MKNKKYILTQDVVIQKGTVLDIAPTNKGGQSYRYCVVGVGKNFSGSFLCTESCIVSDSDGIILELKETK